VGWWQTNEKLAGLADAVGAFLAGEPIVTVPADRFGPIPTDLPLRRLGRMRGPAS